MSRQKIHGRTERHPCGCVSDDIQWLEMCEAHRSETDETHARWAEDHERPELLLAEDRI